MLDEAKERERFYQWWQKQLSHGAEIPVAELIWLAAKREAAEDTRRYLDGIRDMVRDRNPDGFTALDFFAVWNEQYEDQIKRLRAENERLLAESKADFNATEDQLAAKDAKHAQLLTALDFALSFSAVEPPTRVLERVQATIKAAQAAGGKGD